MAGILQCRACRLPLFRIGSKTALDWFADSSSLGQYKRTTGFSEGKTICWMSNWNQATGLSNSSEPKKKEITQFMSSMKGTEFSKELQFEWRAAFLEPAHSESFWHGPVLNLLNEVFPLKELYHVESQTRLYSSEKDFKIRDAAISFTLPYEAKKNGKRTLLFSKDRAVIVELKWLKSRNEEEEEDAILSQLADYGTTEMHVKPHIKEVYLIEMRPEKWRCHLASRGLKDDVHFSEFISWINDPVSDGSFREMKKVKAKMESVRPKNHSVLFEHLGKRVRKASVVRSETHDRFHEKFQQLARQLLAVFFCFDLNEIDG